MRFDAIVVDRRLAVEASLRDGRYRIRIDGRPLDVDLVPLDGHFYSLLVAGCHYEVAVEQVTGARVVHFPGEAVRVEIASSSHAGASVTRSGDGPRSIVAPMPGRIVSVLIEPGARVRAGERLLVMEAMKMENEVLAPRPGVVAEVSVTNGQAVETGALLVVIA